MRTFVLWWLLGACAAKPSPPAEDMVHVPAMKSGAVVLASFWIDRVDVSRRVFEDCVEAGECSGNPGTTYAFVTWREAAALCRWRGLRLPTNLEIVQAERVLDVDSGILWTADLDPTEPAQRLTQVISNLAPPSRRGARGGLDVHSDAESESHRFRCARTADPPVVTSNDNAAFVPPGVLAPRPLLVDRREVSNADYAACVDDGACFGNPFIRAREEPNVPSLVWFRDAVAYCMWKGARLPTSSEWDHAATRSGRYPWGDEPLVGCADVIDARCGNRIDVGTGRRDVTIDGVRDLAGSVDEWVVEAGTYGGAKRGSGYTWNQIGVAGFRCARDLVQ